MPLCEFVLPTPPRTLQAVIAAIVAGVGWSAPIPLFAKQIDTHIPACGGIYQVHFVTEENSLPPSLLAGIGYVGESGNLHRRVRRELLRALSSEQMPFTDPHAAAPCLWVWLQLHRQVGLQVSCFPLVEEEGYSAFWRRGLEDLHLLCLRMRAMQSREQMRPQEQVWYSPVANFGYFPAGWRPSTNFKRGRRGGPLLPLEEEAEQDRCKHGPDVPPALFALSDQPGPAVFDPASLSWGGYHWSAWEWARELRRSTSLASFERGVYRLAQPGSCGTLLLVGYGKLAEAARKASRLDEDLLISFVAGNWGDPQLLAQRSDLCGLYLWQRHTLPLLQFGGPDGSRNRERARASLQEPPLWWS